MGHPPKRGGGGGAQTHREVKIEICWKPDISLESLSIHDSSAFYSKKRVNMGSIWAMPKTKKQLFYRISDKKFVMLEFKVTATDMRYFARSKFSRSLVHKKIFSLT